MERTEDLCILNQNLCRYYEQFSQESQQPLNCFPTETAEIGRFYSSMKAQLLKQQINKNLDSHRKCSQEDRTKKRLKSSIQRPLFNFLPNSLTPTNDNLVEKKLNANVVPLFSGVQRSKKGSYEIAPEIRAVISEDIKVLKQKRQREVFLKKYPSREPKTKEWVSSDASHTANLIKQCNRAISKYKKQSGCQQLKIVDSLHYPELAQECVIDHQFHDVLGIFKKLYMEKKSELINEGLIKYVLKFQKYDRLSKKLKSQNSSLLKHRRRKSGQLTDSVAQTKYEKTAGSFGVSLHKKRMSGLSQLNTGESGTASNGFKSRAHSVKVDFRKNRAKLNL